MPTFTQERIVSTNHQGKRHQPCQHLAISESAIGDVSICPDCNVLHLSLSHVSLRFTPDAFRALTELIGAAQARLDQVARTSAAAAAVLDEKRPAAKLH